MPSTVKESREKDVGKLEKVPLDHVRAVPLLDVNIPIPVALG